ncbi:hypothetical protein ACFQMA_17515 [Halosimplex aquaticum]|uniref:Outer membrane lipoprotein-sorting protein n=1 Tax=Halosimplex aquaticum TaxID=3026162 RepID=A0ABD5Y2E1_9EURY|nr:hypothetical protein [Halosimplex aquaticum]
MRWRLLVALAVVVTAGCGSLFGGDERADPATDTLTPAPVPEVTPTPEQWPVAPGVTANAVADADALVAAHRAATANRSYVWRERRGTTTHPNESVPLFDRTVARVESQTVYHVWTGQERVRLRTGLTSVADYSEYADGTERIVRYRYVGRSDFERQRRHPVDATAHRHIGLSAASAIERYLDVESATVAAVSVDGRRHYEVVGRNWSRPDDDRVTDYTVVAVVSPEGFVRSLDASYTVRSVGEPRRVRYTFAYEKVGETTVDPPEWDAEETDRSS